MILGIEYLEKYEKKGFIGIKDRGEFSAFSLDLKLDKLYKLKLKQEQFNNNLAENSHKLTQKQFINDLLEEVKISKEGIEIRPEDFYLWQPKEKISLKKNFWAEVVTRSSWARLGVNARSDSDDYIGSKRIFEEIEIKPLCILHTSGTRVLIKKEDKFAQLVIHHDSDGYINFSHKKFKELMDEEKLVIKRNKKRLKYEEIKDEDEFFLTMDKKIKVYSGNLLIPGKPKENDFYSIDIGKEKIYLKKDTFFISGSKEYVKIPKGFVGYVTESNSGISRRIKIFPFLTHANAPYIGPENIFEGNITFENRMKFGDVITADMKQAAFFLKYMLTGGKYNVKSRYKNQQSATLSRLK